MSSSLKVALDNGNKLKIKVKQGNLGCSDVQDACNDDGYVILYKKCDNYMIDTVDDENILCVDDFSYIEELVGALV